MGIIKFIGGHFLKNDVRTKKISGGVFSCAFYLIIILTYLVVVGEVAAETLSEEPRFTLNFEQEPMQNVVKMLENQTGYTISYDQKFQKQLVTGEFQDVKITAFFLKVLHKQNPFITISTQDKTISIQTALSASTNTKLRIPKESQNVSKVTQKRRIMPENGLAISKSQRGDIFELPPTPPATVSGNDDHLIDPQTGENWDAVEQMLK